MALMASPLTGNDDITLGPGSPGAGADEVAAASPAANFDLLLLSVVDESLVTHGPVSPEAAASGAGDGVASPLGGRLGKEDTVTFAPAVLSPSATAASAAATPGGTQQASPASSPGHTPGGLTRTAASPSLGGTPKAGTRSGGKPKNSASSTPAPQWRRTAFGGALKRCLAIHTVRGTSGHSAQSPLGQKSPFASGSAAKCTLPTVRHFGMMSPSVAAAVTPGCMASPGCAVTPGFGIWWGTSDTMRPPTAGRPPSSGMDAGGGVTGGVTSGGGLVTAVGTSLKEEDSTSTIGGVSEAVVAEACKGMGSATGAEQYVAMLAQGVAAVNLSACGLYQLPDLVRVERLDMILEVFALSVGPSC